MKHDNSTNGPVKRRINWRRQHKWSGIAAVLLLVVFCVSGIVMNHRELFAGAEISRKWLPSRYRFHDWNGGLMRGTIPYEGKLLVFGTNGVWMVEVPSVQDTSNEAVSENKDGAVDFNTGFPAGADNRQVRNMVIYNDALYAVTTSDLYRLINRKWEWVDIDGHENERLTDIASKGDTLIVAGRSHLYVSTDNAGSFKKMKLARAKGQSSDVSLFKTVWMLHSGELFGLPGKLAVDFIAILLILLSLTGMVHWLLLKALKAGGRRGMAVARMARVVKPNFIVHNIVGKVSVILTMVVVLTGWCLRPPMMIPLVMGKTRPLAGSTLDSDNPWHDKLRVLRYDSDTGEWLLSTSDGFYSLATPDGVPQRLDAPFPVSVMGLNVMEKDSAGNWVCGSFSGMYIWNRTEGVASDYHTGQPAEAKGGMPFGKVAVSGYSKELGAMVEYNKGTSAIVQPEELRDLPMSLWNVSLEAHTGRLFIGQVATYVYILIAGFICFWCLLSGWKVRKK